MAKPYSDYSEKQLILRDHLAIDRTILANESTFLAYIRTSLALVIGGAGVIKFFPSDYSLIIAFPFILGGAVTFLLGLKRYSKMATDIKSIRKQENE